MMSGHGANPIFFNKIKIKNWSSRTLVPPPNPTPMSDNISFLHPLKVDVICV